MTSGHGGTYVFNSSAGEEIEDHPHSAILQFPGQSYYIKPISKLTYNKSIASYVGIMLLFTM